MAWELTHEILRDHTSHSYAALAGWSWIPTGTEIAMWDRMELEGRVKHKGWRPWAAIPDPLAAAKQETGEERAARLERRDRLNRRFHITS